MESPGPVSAEDVLMAGPRFSGASHGQALQARWETQMSNPPIPPGRSEPKYRLSSSFESVGPCSLNVVLIVAPRFSGSDQGEKCDVTFATRFAVMLRSDSIPHPTSSTPEATAASIREVGVIAARPADASTSTGPVDRTRPPGST